MAKKRVFVSFDYDNNLDLKNLLVGQAISRSEVVIVLLGGKTHSASGVRKEVKVANDLSKTRFQIKPQGTNPLRVENAGVVYDWTWDNLKKLLA